MPRATRRSRATLRHSPPGEPSACSAAAKALIHRRFQSVCAGKEMLPSGDEEAAQESCAALKWSLLAAAAEVA